MRIVYFTHSLVSCWNHGNAHFLRGLLRELKKLGHDVVAREPAGGWSLANLLADQGEAGLRPFRNAYGELQSEIYAKPLDAAALCDEADLVIVHEWNEPALVAALGKARRHAGFTLLFHDTHHRAVSDKQAITTFDLSEYDGVLAFGETLAEIYRRWGWGDRVWVWHEAADISLFKPPPAETERAGIVWIGNWGDGERTAELESFLLAPAASEAMALDIFGVRYPETALSLLAQYGAHYKGWAPNALVPEVFSRYLVTVHVPRRFYVDALPGIPTIRMFEALACGIPLISAPWRDSEHLFRPAQDYLQAQNGEGMRRHLKSVQGDPDLRRALVESGLSTIRSRHSCAHRAAELLSIVKKLRQPVVETA